MKTCKKCQNQFTVTDEDKNFLQKFSVKIGSATFIIPEPTFCPNCRQQRRLSFRNERALYRRKCDISGKEIISIYRQNSPYKIYAPQEWWSDKWDPFEYGRDFDFKRPFFEQFAELKKSIPHLSLHVTNNEGSDYINLSGYNKLLKNIENLIVLCPGCKYDYMVDINNIARNQVPLFTDTSILPL